MKTIIATLFFVTGFFITPNSWAKMGAVDVSCQFKGIALHGKVKFVTSFPDIKIKYVGSFPDLNVKMVSSFPDNCGEWQIVESFPDFTVQTVESFPDIEVKTVESFPGVS